MGLVGGLIEHDMSYTLDAWSPEEVESFTVQQVMHLTVIEHVPRASNFVVLRKQKNDDQCDSCFRKMQANLSDVLTLEYSQI